MSEPNLSTLLVQGRDDPDASRGSFPQRCAHELPDDSIGIAILLSDAGEEVFLRPSPHPANEITTGTRAPTR